MFDTVGWHEVVSRLRRARGMIKGLGEVLADGKVTAIHDAEFVAELRRLEGRILVEANGLGTLSTTIGSKPRTSTVRQVRETTSRPYERKTSMGPAFVLGQLRAALSFIAKCRRDAPQVEAQGGAMMTSDERAIIEREIKVIRREAGLTLRAFEN